MLSLLYQLLLLLAAAAQLAGIAAELLQPQLTQKSCNAVLFSGQGWGWIWGLGLLQHALLVLTCVSCLQSNITLHSRHPKTHNAPHVMMQFLDTVKGVALLGRCILFLDAL